MNMHTYIHVHAYVPFQCFISPMPRGLRRISEGASIQLIRSSSRGISARWSWLVPQHRDASIQRLNSSFDTPRRAQCMYSGDIPLMKSKEFKQESHDGPLTPVTYMMCNIHQQVRIISNAIKAQCDGHMFTAKWSGLLPQQCWVRQSVFPWCSTEHVYIHAVYKHCDIGTGQLHS